MHNRQLVVAVCVLTVAVTVCITLLSVFHHGDSSRGVTAILTVATPALSVLIVLLQGQRTERKVEEVKQEARSVVANMVNAAEKVEEVKASTAQVAERMEEVKVLVNGKQDELRRRIAELEHELEQKHK